MSTGELPWSPETFVTNKLLFPPPPCRTAAAATPRPPATIKLLPTAALVPAHALPQPAARAPPLSSGTPCLHTSWVGAR